MKLWGGRFETGPSEVFEQFSGSLDFDRKLVFADIEGSRAFANALARAGIVSAAEGDRLLQAFDEIGREARDADYFAGATDEDVHTFVIRKLGEKVGTLAGKIHTGRSRNEQVSLDTRLYLRTAADALLGGLAEMMGALLDLAGKYPDAVIPGYTHLRRAQAVLWPHYLLAYFEMFSRDFERVEQARARANVLPLGSGALAGSGFPFDRRAIANELQFPAITRNSMDVSGDRDFALDFLYSSSLIMLHLSRLCEDWILYSSEEFDWMSLGDGVTSGSSLMPQKKNPDSMELVRGKAGRVFGDLMALLTTLKGLPLAYNKDMQEDKEAVFDAFDTVSASLRVTGTVLRNIGVNKERAAAASSSGYMNATELADYLVRKGMPFRDAHEVVGKIVMKAIAAGKELEEMDLSEFGEDVYQALTLESTLQTKHQVGGTAREAVEKELTADKTDLTID
jgi:argininosuccinate lyase